MALINKLKNMKWENSEMNGIQKLFETFRDYSEIEDIRMDLQKLDSSYKEGAYHHMNNLIFEIAQKHPIEAKIWNKLYTKTPKTMRDKYTSACNFLYALACKKFVECGVDLKVYLSANDYSFIEPILRQ